ncbi:MAG: glycosyltransferase family 4 protein [Anaerolineaceae bacterium]|nr:glycosyltransferase family 4 protein [Anaerolineaceae bacterium]
MTQQKKIALVYGNYYRQIKMYYTRWPLQFNNDRLDVRFFSLISYQHRKNVEDSTFYIEGWVTRIRRSIKFLFQNIKTANQWLIKQEAQSIFEKLKVWSEIGNLITYRPDIIHLVNSQNYIKIRGLYFPHSPKIIASFHGFDIVSRQYSSSLWRQYLKELFERGDCLHFVSEWLYNQALYLGAPEYKSRVIYAGVDTVFFKPQINKEILKTEQKIRLISTGRLVPLKGYEYVFPAIRQLLTDGENVEYTIIGTGPDFERLNQIIKGLGIINQVKFVGKKPKSEVKKLLNSADIYLHPSITEALPGAVLEACAMQLPIVATNVGGIPEIIKNGVNGLLVPPRDPDTLALSIRQFVRNPAFAQAMGQAARLTAENKFSIEKETSNWLELYLSL